jgi:hypothetical protein
MKISFSVILISILLFTSFTLEEKYLIDIRLLPNNNYRISNKTETVSEVDFQANEEILNQLREKGLQFPLDVNVTQVIIQKVETGEIKSDSSFSVKMLIEEYSKDQIVNGIETVLPENQNLKGLLILGDYTIEKKFEHITIESDVINDELKATLPKAMENMFKNINYPNYPLSIGDSFKQEVPLQFPIGGAVVINIKMIIYYTLENLTEDKAYFNTNTEIVVTQESKDYSIKAEGGGEGKLVHDIKMKYAIENTSDLTMNFEIDFEHLKIVSKSNTKTVYKLL